MEPVGVTEGVVVKKKHTQYSVYELNQWPEGKFLEFFAYAALFTVENEKAPGQRWSFTKEVMAKANESIWNGDNPYFKEFAERIDETTGPRYFLKLSKMVMLVGGFLKRHPAFVTETIRKIVESNTKFAWITGQYTKYTSDGGQSMILPDAKNTIGVNGKLLHGKDPEIMLMEAQLRIVDIYTSIANSISIREVRELPTEKKLQLMKDLAPLVKREKLARPNNINVFLQNRDSAAKLEQSLLDYANGEIEKAKRKES